MPVETASALQAFALRKLFYGSRTVMVEMTNLVQNVKVAVALSLVIMFAIAQQIAARPKANAFQNSLDTITGCHIDSKLQDTCQRCAKQTKSNVVYPMCCSNEDDVLVWCQRYMGYGIH